MDGQPSELSLQALGLGGYYVRMLFVLKCFSFSGKGAGGAGGRLVRGVDLGNGIRVRVRITMPFLSYEVEVAANLQLTVSHMDKPAI